MAACVSVSLAIQAENTLSAVEESTRTPRSPAHSAAPKSKVSSRRYEKEKAVDVEDELIKFDEPSVPFPKYTFSILGQ